MLEYLFLSRYSLRSDLVLCFQKLICQAIGGDFLECLRFFWAALRSVGMVLQIRRRMR